MMQRLISRSEFFSFEESKTILCQFTGRVYLEMFAQKNMGFGQDDDK